MANNLHSKISLLYNLTGKTNTQVASYYQSLFGVCGQKLGAAHDSLGDRNGIGGNRGATAGGLTVAANPKGAGGVFMGARAQADIGLRYRIHGVLAGKTDNEDTTAVRSLRDGVADVLFFDGEGAEQAINGGVSLLVCQYHRSANTFAICGGLLRRACARILGWRRENGPHALKDLFEAADVGAHLSLIARICGSGAIAHGFQLIGEIAYLLHSQYLVAGLRLF